MKFKYNSMYMSKEDAETMLDGCVIYDNSYVEHISMMPLNELQEFVEFLVSKGCSVFRSNISGYEFNADKAFNKLGLTCNRDAINYVYDTLYEEAFKKCAVESAMKGIRLKNPKFVKGDDCPNVVESGHFPRVLRKETVNNVIDFNKYKEQRSK